MHNTVTDLTGIKSALSVPGRGGATLCGTNLDFFFSFGAAGGGSLFDNADTIVSTLLSASPSVASSDSADHYAYSKQAEGANSSLISAQQSRRR